jgi:hypothetical protein
MSTDKKKSKRGPGRPMKPKGEGKAATIIVRVTDEEKKQALQSAKEEDKTISDWAREKLGFA